MADSYYILSDKLVLSSPALFITSFFNKRTGRLLRASRENLY